jgi:hypothetical protein
MSYSLCSSSLLLANKMAVEHIPSAAAISLLQIIFSAIVCLLIQAVGYPIDSLFNQHKLRAYAPYIVLFVCVLYTNMRALSCSNVETVIVFRASTPIAVCAVEYLSGERAFPSARSMCSMIILATGAVLYCVAESQLSLASSEAYLWVAMYFVLLTIEMTYGKSLASTVKMDSVWGPVLYCNALSVVPMFLFGLAEGQDGAVASFASSLLGVAALSSQGLGVLVFSCVAGTAIGYSSWQCRSMLSATSFTVVGVCNKFLTVLLNVLLWDKHSSWPGLLAVCVCLGSGAFYEQAPRRLVAAGAAAAEKAEKAQLLEEKAQGQGVPGEAAEEGEAVCGLARALGRAV